MKVVRCLPAALVMLVASKAVQAQLPGLPYSPWQSGVGYFVGPYGSGATHPNPAGGVYCIDINYILQYGYPWQAFLTPISPRNATPSGYTYAGIGAPCMSPGQPNGFNPYGVPNLPQGNNPYGYGTGSGNLLGHPPTPPSDQGPPPNVAALRILPQAPPPPPPPPDPPAPPPPPPTLDPHVTPEPATWLLLGTGLVAILAFAALKSTRA